MEENTMFLMRNRTHWLHVFIQTLGVTLPLWG